ncbi:MAG: hypothetical protein WBN04_21655 [Paracoccaceae bacterium]
MKSTAEPPASELSLKVLLRNTAIALRDTQHLALELEDAIIDARTGATDAQTTPHQSGQVLDLLVQRIADLARFSDGLADLMAADIKVNPQGAFDRTQLRDLVSVLRFGTPALASRPAASVDLF